MSAASVRPLVTRLYAQFLEKAKLRASMKQEKYLRDALFKRRYLRNMTGIHIYTHYSSLLIELIKSAQK